MKALLLDSVTTKVVSMVYSQTQILEKEVYLVETLGKAHDPMPHLKAAVFIQPTEANFDLLVKELREPKFKEYHLFFSNIVPNDMLTRLGRLDEQEMVMQVHEYYADYLAINEDFFHFGIPNSITLSSNSMRNLESAQILERHVNGILSVLLSLKRRPSQIRHQAGSEVTRRLASEVLTRIESEDGLFEFRKPSEAAGGGATGPLLLILDRRDDPVTPLLTQWTYQAMVHELLGLHNNRVVLKGRPNISKDLEEIVLSVTQDEFFAKNRYANFGDLGSAVKQLLDDYQKVSKKNENITSIEDMQAFLLRYPDLRSKSINVSKHVAVLGELGRLTDVCQLLDVSQLEQEIACSNDHSLHKQHLVEKLRSPKVKYPDKLRLLLLFLLRYESRGPGERAELKSILSSSASGGSGAGAGGSKQLPLAAIDALFEYASEAKRAPGLFSAGGLINSFTRRINSSINGVENVYTQHQPLLTFTLDSILRGKLKDAVYPPLLPTPPSSAAALGVGGGPAGAGGRPSEVIVFIVGGATFEEATKVAEFNAANPSIRVLLGGSCVQNSDSFLWEVTNLYT